MTLRLRMASFVMILLVSPWSLGAQTKPAASTGSAAKKQIASTSETKKPAATPPARPAKKTATPTRRPAASAARRAPAVPAGQTRPTRERYAEIQKALAEAGYYSGKTDGIWGEASIQALKSFQEAQGLEPTGKIDALTLIRLDLGPKYESSTETAANSAPAP